MSIFNVLKDVLNFLFSGCAITLFLYFKGLRPLKPKLKENFIKAIHSNAYANYDMAKEEAKENFIKEKNLIKLFPKTMDFINKYDYKNYNHDEVFGLRISAKDSEKLKKLRKDFNKSCEEYLKKDILKWI